MKRSSNIASKMISLLILFVAVIFVCADLPSALAQNTNSSTTGGDSMMQNMNSGNTNRGMGRRRARRRARRMRRRARAADANANMSGDTSGNANMSGDTSMQDANANMAGDTQSNMNTGRTRRGRRGGRGTRRAADANANTTGDTTGADTSTAPATTGDTTGGTQAGSMPGMGTFGDVADLSGTYTGTINYPDGSMTGEATLTITANTFTITAGSATQNGTLSARSWPGYTALSMRFGDTLPATIVSTRAWHKGRTLRIQSVPGETRKFTFNGRSS